MFISQDRSFFDKVVAGSGRARGDIPADAAAEVTDAAGKHLFTVFYSFDRDAVPQFLADAQDIAWGYASAAFRNLFPEFFPTAAVA